MARPQNSPIGLFAKNRIDVGSQQLTYNSTALLFNGGIRLSGQANAIMTGDSTGVVLVGGIKISSARTLTANSTGFVATAESAIPSTDEGAAFTLVSDSTGVALAINATGTTWKYLATTSVRADAS